MSYHDRSKRTPNVKPVIRIELSEKNVKLRTFLIVFFLAVAAVALVVGLTSLLSTDPGWQEVEASSSEANCSGDFTLNYDFGASGMSATAEKRQISQLYTEATENAYRIFSPDVLEEGLYNVGYINAHINEVISVDPVLYQALETLKAYENRTIYLAPVYVEYDRVFFAGSDQEAAQFDPTMNSEAAEFVGQIASFVNDPAMIDLELLGDHRMRLNVSDAYLAFAKEYEITEFIDFAWMKNAFIADYIADMLLDNGFTSGYLASYDGFTRNLDSRGESYSMNIFDRMGNAINLPAVMSYDKPVSIVFLRNFPMSDRDTWSYYGYESGAITTSFVDASDGMSKSSMNNLVSYSYSESCAEILMQMIPVFIADDFAADALRGMEKADVYSVWSENQVIRYNDAELSLVLNGENGNGYSIRFAE